jgi:hypothetical protein
MEKTVCPAFIPYSGQSPPVATRRLPLVQLQSISNLKNESYTLLR